MTINRAYFLNLLAAFCLALVVLIAFIPQFVFTELPCPLCLLQRWGLLAMTVGLLLNIKHQFSSRHYGLTLLAGLYTLSVSTRQILLHILPNDPGYGDPLLGIHLYTWVAVISLMVIIFVASMLFSSHLVEISIQPVNDSLLKAGNIVYWFVLSVIVLNVISAFLECGPYVCPDNPQHYWRLLGASLSGSSTC